MRSAPALAAAGFMLSRPLGGGRLPLLATALGVALYAAAPVVCLLAARRSAERRLAWHLLGAGLVVGAVGHVYAGGLLGPGGAGAAAAGRAVALGFYPLAAAALLVLLRRHPAPLTTGLVADVATGGLAAAAFAAAAAARTGAAVVGGAGGAGVVSLGRPVLDLLLLFLAVVVLAVHRWRSAGGVWLLAGAAAAFVIADLAHLVSGAGGDLPAGTGDAVWVGAALLMALAPAWQEQRGTVVAAGWLLFTVPVLGALVGLGLLVTERVGSLATGLAAATVVTALARLALTIGEFGAVTDGLTGLTSRRGLYLHTRALLRQAAAGESRMALLLLDLDRFKDVNDSLGHLAGDQLLRQVADRLTTAVGASAAALVRLGGDEFAVVLPDVDADVAQRVARTITAVLSVPVVLEGIPVQTTVSIGIAVAPEHGTDMSSLLRNADIAMYSAKAGQTGVSVYVESTDVLGGTEKLHAVDSLRAAIRERRLTMHFQPKIDMATGDVVGVEALVRWQHPVRGLLPPAAFLPLAADAGLMHELTVAVLEQSLDQAARWVRAGRPLPVAVNLPPSLLVDADLPRRLGDLLAGRGLDPRLLELEITEEALIHDRERGRLVLEQLRRLGITVAVDDFGTGYSSLSYLRDLPVDELKLDRSFLLPMTSDDRAAAIVRATIGLAHSLGLQVVAEGVEDEATAYALATYGCDLAQGYHYSPPLDPEAFDAWLDGYARREQTA